MMSITTENEEMLSLLNTLGVNDVQMVIQKRSHPHKVGFLGPGKLNEVEEQLAKREVEAIVVNGDLKPSQHHYLEMRFQKECIDRTGIILRIFADHAHTPEAIAQVTLARLRYEQPFLREWIHKAKTGDRPGFLAGGAYATDVYYEHARSHARKIERKLKELAKQREILRRKRHERGYLLVSLAGYTNAGKSALFNKLSDAGVEVNDRLFSTLSTTTRRVKGIRANVLIADTVGFIKDLPPDLIDAFNSTLEEIFNADLILLVFDASDPLDKIEAKLRTSLDILLPRISDQVLVVVGNKRDLLAENMVDAVRSRITNLVGSHDVMFVSAHTGQGIDGLRELILAACRRTRVLNVELPLTDDAFSLVSRLREICFVSEDAVTDRLMITIRCNPADSDRLIGMIGRVNGKIVNSNDIEAGLDDPIQSTISTGSEGAPLKREY